MMVMEILISVTLLLVGIVALVVIHICIVGRAFRRAFEQSALGEGNNVNGIKIMSKEELKTIPCFEYKGAAAAAATADRGSSPVDCVVCLENFKLGDKCSLLPNCKHSFHAQCIDSWLLQAPICPICRTKVSPLKIAVIPEDESNGSVDVRIELT